MVPALNRLPERKQMLIGPVAAQRFHDPFGLDLADPHVAQLQQRRGIALAGKDRAHHRKTARPGQRADHVVQLDIHPLQRLLHVLDMPGRRRNMLPAQTQIVLQTANMRRRNKPRPQQAMSVQGRAPLAVLHVALATRKMARLAPIDHPDIQAGGFQNAIERQPVHARRLHRHRADPMLDQKVAQRLQLRGHRAKHPRRTPADRNMHLLAADIDKRRARIKHSQFAHSSLHVLSFGRRARRKPDRV